MIVVISILWVVGLFTGLYCSTFLLKNKALRLLLAFALTVAIAPAPLYDEIRGKAEFEELCANGRNYWIAGNANGKKFNLRYESTPMTVLPGYIRPVEAMTITYTDTDSGTVMAKANAYFAKGGWLVRYKILRDSGGGDGAYLGMQQCFPPANLAEQMRLKDITNVIIN